MTDKARTAKTKVLILIKGLGIGGAEMLIAEGARYWSRDEFNYEVAYVLPWKDQLVGSLQAHDIPVHMIGSRRGLTPGSAMRLRRLIADRSFDLVHAHLPTMGVVARLVSPVPVVYTEHNMSHSYRLATRLGNRMTYGRNAAVTAVSGAVAESVSGWPGPEAVVIPNGVSVHVTPEAASRARAELGLTPADPLVAHVGNIRPGKGHELLVEATVDMVRKRPELTVVSAGGEKYPGDLERVRRLAEEAGVGDRLHFLGRRPDALDFVAAADVFVNPSRVEGLPVAVLEAMALETPVVATAVGGVPGIVTHEETGLLVDPGDASAVAAGVIRFLDDPELSRKVAAEARSMVERDYGLEPMVRATEAVYRKLSG